MPVWIQLTLPVGMIGLALYVWLTKKKDVKDVKEAPRLANAVVDGSDEDSMKSSEEPTITQDKRYKCEETLGKRVLSVLQKESNSVLNLLQNLWIRFVLRVLYHLW